MSLWARVGAGARSRPAAAIVSQGIVAGSSVVLQLVVSRSLGASQLGQFALLFGTLVTLNALQTGWLGDSLTVLDRHAPHTRAALWRYQLIILVVVSAVAMLVASVVEGISSTTALIFAGVMALWALEETGRRLLIARREFWPLALNDTVYAVGALGSLGIAALAGRSMSLDLVLASMGVGSTAAIVAAVVQLPRDELRPIRGVGAAMRQVSSFAFWRSLQVGLRPAALSVTRFVVAGTASTAALGQLEAARIVTAPVLTLMSGIGVYLLPTYTHAVKEGREPRPPIVAMMWVLVAVPIVYVLGILLVRDQVVEVLTDGKYAVTTTAIVCWGFYAGMFGAGIPPAHAVTARERSRLAFGIRALDNGIGVALAVVIAVVVSVSWVPLGLAVGGALGAILLLRAARTLQAQPVPVGSLA